MKGDEKKGERTARRLREAEKERRVDVTCGWKEEEVCTAQ